MQRQKVASKVASFKITVRAVEHRGETWWRVRYWKDGKVKRPLFDSKKSANAKAASLRGQSSHAERVWNGLSESERDKLILSYQKPSAPAPSIRTVIDEMIIAKENAGRSEDYTASLNAVLNQFVNGSAGKSIGDFEVIDVEKFLDSKKLASRSTLRSRISTLFKYSVRRGYRIDNPCARLEPITVSKKPPTVFTAEQFRDAVEWLKQNSPEGLAWFALSSTCGLRPEEALKTTVADLNFTEGFIRVEAQTTKVRQRRIVYPKIEAMKFLKRTLKNGGGLPLDPQFKKRMLAGVVWKSKEGIQRRPGLRQALGFATWPKDITRHTAASYWLAIGVSAGIVSEMLGHSEKTLKRDYKALVTQKEAAKFWKLVESLS